MYHKKGDTIDLQVSFNIAASTFILCVYFIDYSAFPLLKCTFASLLSLWLPTSKGLIAFQNYNRES